MPSIARLTNAGVQTEPEPVEAPVDEEVVPSEGSTEAEAPKTRRGPQARKVKG